MDQTREENVNLSKPVSINHIVPAALVLLLAFGVAGPQSEWPGKRHREVEHAFVHDADQPDPCGPVG